MDYYVATNGGDGNTGTESSPWETIAYSALHAQAGDTVHIKGGNYGREHVVITNSGFSENYITFEGYDGTPIIDGQDQTGTGVMLSSKDYIEIKNLGITRYLYGFYVTSSLHVILDTININDIGDHGLPYSGHGIYLVNNANYGIVRNCVVTDSGAVNIMLAGAHSNVIENCFAYGVNTGICPDYYMVIAYSHDNIIRNCYSENKHRDSKAQPGHGIGIKDNYHNGYNHPHSYNNKIINCETHGHGEHFFAAHPVYENEFINCVAYNDDLLDYHQWNDGFRVRDGAHHNTFIGCRAVGTRLGITSGNTVEGPAEIQYADHNVFMNCIFEDLINGGMCLREARNTLIQNCIVTDAPKLITHFSNADNSEIANCIVTDVSSIGVTGPTITYSNFWNNGFSTPSGTGNISVDPQFSDNNYHLLPGSPCIDVGDPNDDYSNEPLPNGGRINMGAYGNTVDATQSNGEENMTYTQQITIQNSDPITIDVPVEESSVLVTFLDTGIPMVGKTVEFLTEDESTILQTVVTDDNGTVTLVNVLHGNYSIRIIY